MRFAPRGVTRLSPTVRTAPFLEGETMFTLRDLLLELKDAELLRKIAEDFDKKLGHTDAESWNRLSADDRDQFRIHYERAYRYAHELHAKPSVKRIYTVCLAKGKTFDSAAVRGICAALALQRGQTLDDLLPLDAHVVAGLLTSTEPPRMPAAVRDVNHEATRIVG